MKGSPRPATDLSSQAQASKSSYFKSLFSQLADRSTAICKAAETVAELAENNIKEEVNRKGIYLFEVKSSLDKLKSSEQDPAKSPFPASHMSPKQKFDEALREMRIKQSLKMKADLEKRLQSLDANINVLSSASPVFSKQDEGRSKKKMYSWLTEEERNKWKEDWSQKVQGAKQFTNKVLTIQKEIQQSQKIRDEKLKKEEQEMEKQKQLEEEEKAKMEEIAKLEAKERKIKKAEEKKKERERLSKLAQEKHIHKPTLHEKMSQRFFDNFEMPELEKKKAILAEKRSAFAPLRKLGIEDHEKQYEEAMKKREEERKKKLLETRLSESDYTQKMVKEFRTVFTEQASQKQKEERLKAQEEKEQSKKKIEKMLIYAKEVKDNYAPEPSDAKAKELQDKISKLKHPVKQKPERKPRLTPNERASILERGGYDKRKNSSRVNVATDMLEENNGDQGLAKPKKQPERLKNKETKKEALSRSERLSEEKEFKKIDYLAEIKKKYPPKKQEEMKGVQYCNEVMQQADISPRQKYRMVKAQAELMEEAARRKEGMYTVKGGTVNDPDIGNEVSDMYINAIKAKLSLLNL